MDPAVALRGGAGQTYGYGTEGTGTPAGARGGPAGGGVPVAAAESRVPQFTQNMLDESFRAPHAAQTFGTDKPTLPAGQPARWLLRLPAAGRARSYFA